MNSQPGLVSLTNNKALFPALPDPSRHLLINVRFPPPIPPYVKHCLLNPLNSWGPERGQGGWKDQHMEMNWGNPVRSMTQMGGNKEAWHGLHAAALGLLLASRSWGVP